MKQEKLTPQIPMSPPNKKGKANEIDDYIGRKLLEFRNKYNLTQADVAKKLDVSTQQYQKYENGDNRLSLSKFLYLSRSVAFPLRDFIDGYIEDSINTGLSDNAQKSLDALDDENVEIVKDTADIIKAYHSIEDTEKRKNFVKAVKEMAKALK
ncbi:MAG: helix-turn-helix transcriptional regulator [Pseudomonadota bacterium]